MITKKQVKHAAQLARLGLSQKEEKKFKKELSDILEFVEKLNQVKTDKVEPFVQVAGLSNTQRKDRGRKKTKKEIDRLLDLAPELKDRYVKVKAIL